MCARRERRKANNQFWNFFSIESHKQQRRRSQKPCRTREFLLSAIRETMFSWERKKKTSFIVPFLRFLFFTFLQAILSCQINCRTCIYLPLYHLHMIAENFMGFFFLLFFSAEQHFMPNFISVFYCFFFFLFYSCKRISLKCFAFL